MEVLRRWAWLAFWAAFLFRGLTLFVDVSRNTERVAWLLGFVALSVGLLVSRSRLRPQADERQVSQDG